MEKPNAAVIKEYLDTICYIQCAISDIGNAIDSAYMAKQEILTISLFKNALLFAWERYGYGNHGDFDTSGDYGMGYLLFELKVTENFELLLAILKHKSPFKVFEENGHITNGLIELFTKLYEEMKAQRSER